MYARSEFCWSTNPVEGPRKDGEEAKAIKTCPLHLCSFGGLIPFAVLNSYSIHTHYRWVKAENSGKQAGEWIAITHKEDRQPVRAFAGIPNKPLTLNDLSIRIDNVQPRTFQLNDDENFTSSKFNWRCPEGAATEGT